MLAIITFEAQRVGFLDYSGPQAFWHAVKFLNEEAYGRPETESIDIVEAMRFERRFSAAFPSRLEKLINGKFFFDEGQKLFKRPISIRLLNVEYGSLKAILDVVGVDSSEARELVLTALSAYAPQAFRDAMGMDVNLPTSVVPLQIGDSSEQSAKSSDGVAAKGMAGVGRAWIIANTSLILPVLLAFAIFYYLFAFYVGQSERLNSELAGLRAERAEYMKMLAAQNSKVIEELVKQSVSSAGTAKSTTEILAGIIKDKAEEKQKKE